MIENNKSELNKKPFMFEVKDKDFKPQAVLTESYIKKCIKTHNKLRKKKCSNHTEQTINDITKEENENLI